MRSSDFATYRSATRDLDTTKKNLQIVWFFAATLLGRPKTYEKHDTSTKIHHQQVREHEQNIATVSNRDIEQISLRDMQSAAKSHR